MWQQSIDSNRAAHAAAVAYVRKTLGPESFDTETVHTLDYLEYAYLQTAQDRAAKEIVDKLSSFRQSAAPNLPTAYAVAAIPVRYALERRDWAAAGRVTQINTIVAARCEVTLQGLIENSEQIRAAAFAAGQFSAAISAIREIGILSGKRIERKEHGMPSEFTDLENMTANELKSLHHQRGFSAAAALD
jgi:hypothetical protein